jgi:hypothetical protein
MGSNHIWNTSSGKRPLRSHFTVSQRFEEVVSEGIEGEDGTAIHNHGKHAAQPLNCRTGEDAAEKERGRVGSSWLG